MKQNNAFLGYLFIIYAAGCLALALWLSSLNSQAMPSKPQLGPLPDFSTIQDTKTRKLAFFNYLRPAIEQQNEHYLSLRQKINVIKITLDSGKSASSADKKLINRLGKRYRVNDELSFSQQVDALLRRVDIIPESMVLAQAAMESGWGNSRFAREANNLFGQWCFTQGCGLVPSRRTSGKKHEVKLFSSVDAAIADYFRNINSHPAYKKVRQIRADERLTKQDISGYKMVAGLDKYSIKGQVYIDELRAMIRGNKLEG